jgi:hypothetical protein
MSNDPYEILNVSARTPSIDIGLAYLEAMDRANAMGEPERADAARKATLAYDTLHSSDKRQRYDQAVATSVCPVCSEAVDRSTALEHLAKHGELPVPDMKCEVCGRGPTRFYSYRSNRGFLLFRVVRDFEGHLCAVCARGMYRRLQTINLSWGWFGFLSFFTTIIYAFFNANEYHSQKKALAAPSPADPALDEKLGGRPVFLGVVSRLVPFLGIVALAVWIAFRALY